MNSLLIHQFPRAGNCFAHWVFAIQRESKLIRTFRHRHFPRGLSTFAALLALAGFLHAQPFVLQNLAYRLEVSRDHIAVARVDTPSLVRKISPELDLTAGIKV